MIIEKILTKILKSLSKIISIGSNLVYTLDFLKLLANVQALKLLKSLKIWAVKIG